MAQTGEHYALYETISGLIDYCNENNLPQTAVILTLSISTLCEEEGNLSFLAMREIAEFSKII